MAHPNLYHAGRSERFPKIFHMDFKMVQLHIPVPRSRARKSFLAGFISLQTRGGNGHCFHFWKDILEGMEDELRWRGTLINNGSLV